MPDDCGCGQSVPKADTITRREFIKTTGVVAAGVALASTPFRITHLPGLPSASVDADTIKLALIIATTDPMYQELDVEIQALGMKLDNSFEAVKFADDLGFLVGIVIRHNFSPSKRMGADLALTVDVSSGTLTNVQALIGWSLVDMLIIRSITLDARDAVETILGLNKDGVFSFQIRPRTESHLTFPYQFGPSFSTLDLVQTGWPPHAEDPMAGYWHYMNGVKTEWLTDRGVAVYRLMQVKESNAVYGDQFTNLPFTET